jgi:hypothetical protein
MLMNRYLIITFCIWSFCLHGQIKESYMKAFEPKKSVRQPTFSLKTSFGKRGNITKVIQKLLDDYGDYSTITSVITYNNGGKKDRLIVTETKKGFPERRSEFTYIYSDQGYEEISKDGKGKRILYLDKNR